MNKISRYNSSISNSVPVSGSSTKLKSRRMLLTVLFCKSHDQMVRFPAKRGDQTNETESPNLINTTGLAKRWVYTKAFFISIKLGMSSLFINLILKTSHFLYLKVLNERISKWAHLSFYHKRFPICINFCVFLFLCCNKVYFVFFHDMHERPWLSKTILEQKWLTKMMIFLMKNSLF